MNKFDLFTYIRETLKLSTSQWVVKVPTKKYRLNKYPYLGLLYPQYKDLTDPVNPKLGVLVFDFTFRKIHVLKTPDLLSHFHGEASKCIYQFDVKTMIGKGLCQILEFEMN